jgi:hypothetical protein
MIKCALPMMAYYEYIMIGIWYWLLFINIVNLCALCQCVYSTLLMYSNVSFIRKRVALQLMQHHIDKNMCDKCQMVCLFHAYNSCICIKSSQMSQLQMISDRHISSLIKTYLHHDGCILLRCVCSHIEPIAASYICTSLYLLHPRDDNETNECSVVSNSQGSPMKRRTSERQFHSNIDDKYEDMQHTHMLDASITV